MFTIDTFTIPDESVDKDTLSKNISVEANQTLDLGVSKNRFPVLVRADMPMPIYSFQCYLSELEYKTLLQLMLNQRKTKIGSYTPVNNTNILEQLFYTFSSTFSTGIGNSYCYVQTMTLDDVLYQGEELRYLVSVELIEIQQL